jgi:hypothetical protein
MTTTYAAVQLIAGGKPYVFSVDATDGAEATLVNVVSNRGLGDTFSGGTTISHIGPITLNSSDATGASRSQLGAIILDPQNNVCYQVPPVDPEATPIMLMTPCNIPVGLNFKFVITTVNA